MSQERILKDREHIRGYYISPVFADMNKKKKEIVGQCC